MSRDACEHRADDEPPPAGVLDLLLKDVKRCGAAVTHCSPLGFYCERHARAVAEAAHAPNTPLGILLRAAGKAVPPIEELLEQWTLRPAEPAFDDEEI